jgi:hypothetical protein
MTVQRRKNALEKTDTIGLIGAFGSGKTTIVGWLQTYAHVLAKDPEANYPQLWFCEVSCWGFEDTSSAINQLLSKAVAKVGEKTDCFSIRHLPEAYRKTFSAGGDWLRTTIDLVLGSSDPVAQFEFLSDILESVKARLVIIVDDLDRTSGAKFDRKEMTALLYRIKQAKNVTFILSTGGASRDNIDFAKLCENIATVRTFETQQVIHAIQVLRSRCQMEPEHISTFSQLSPWLREEHTLSSLSPGEITPSHAAALLLRTPRGLKQSLSHTYRAWQILVGEIDFDHLLAINILRYAAPEAFEFFCTNWRALKEEPGKNVNGESNESYFRTHFQMKWGKAIEGVDWDPLSAITLIEFLIPESGRYLRVKKPYHAPVKQSIDDKKYFDRAIHQHVERTDVRDQTVIKDILSWMKSRDSSSPLVLSVSNGGEYLKTFDMLAPLYMSSDQEMVYAFCKQVFDRILAHLDMVYANGELKQPFFSVKKLMRGSPGRYHNDLPQQWLSALSAKAVPISMPLVNQLYSHYATGSDSILYFDQVKVVRTAIYESAKAVIKTGSDVVRVFIGINHLDLFYFIYPPGDRYDDSLYHAPDFDWLAKPLIEALQIAPESIAKKLAYYVHDMKRSSDMSIVTYTTSLPRLFAIFAFDSTIVLRAIEAAVPSAEGWERDALTQTAHSGFAAYFEFASFIAGLFFFFLGLRFQSLWLFPSNQNGPDGDNSVIRIEDTLLLLVKHLGELVVEFRTIEGFGRED